MNINKHSFFRFLCIDYCLRTKTKVTLSKLTAFCKTQLDELGVRQALTRKTTLNDIEDLKNQFSSPIEFKKSGNFYSYKTQDYTFLNLSPELLHNLFQNLKVGFLISDSRKTSEIVLFERSSLDTGIEHLATIARAIILKRKIEFEYQAISDKKPRKHCVSPHLLKQNNNDWYLLAIKEGEKGIRTYNLARLKVPKLTKKQSEAKVVSPSPTRTKLPTKP